MGYAQDMCAMRVLQHANVIWPHRTWKTMRDTIQKELKERLDKLSVDLFRWYNYPRPLHPAPESWFSDDDDN